MFKTIEERDFLRYKLKTDTLFFARYFFKQQYNRSFVVGQHHKTICDLLRRILKGEITHAIINLPPRYGKTELIVKSLMAQGLAINPQAKFIHTSYSDSLALDNSETVRDLVRSDEYQALFPMKVKNDSKSKKKWFTELGGGVYATSSGGQITGFGAGLVDEDEKTINDFISDFDLIEGFGGAFIIDDPLKPEDAFSETKRNAVNQRFDTTFRSRINSKRTPFIIVMQRVHEDDLTGYLVKKEPDVWTVLSLPALSEEMEALWEFKHTVDELLNLKKINQFVFETQYQQNCKLLKTGGEFLDCFNYQKHVKHVQIDLKLPFHIVYDDNSLPYVSIQLWQIDERNKEARQVHELPCRPPFSDAFNSGSKLNAYLKSIDYKDVLLIHGDATSNKRNTIDPSGQSFYSLFEKTIKSQFKVIGSTNKSNPSVPLSGNFVNQILENGVDGWKVFINETCVVSTNDYIETKKDKNGGILKTRTTTNGQSFEKNGHMTDCIRYLLTDVLEAEYRKFIGKGALSIGAVAGW